MSKTKNTLFSIYGMEIREDSLYEIREKLDPNAPDAFKSENTTKLLAETIIDSEPVAAWDSSLGSWDTGLLANSKLLAKAVVNETERALIIKVLQNKVVKPIEEKIGKGGLRGTSDNNPFWDGFKTEVARFKIFNTAEPESLYKLYMLLIKKKLAPKDKEKHPAWDTASYTIIDKEESLSREEIKSSEKAKAFGLYYQLKNTKDLPIILDWINVKIQSTTPEATKDAVFDRFVSDSKNASQNIREFIDVVEMFSDEKTSEVFSIHNRLKEMHRKGAGITLVKQEIYMDDQYIGNSFKVAAKKVLDTPELYETFMSLQK